MSESSKMGLFGSKDRTKETKKEGTKDDTPDRYAPYCIDSDSETYDTEALSIMDINDIIGVQAEHVSDSTLESEIAALSQMITESKTDGSQSILETKAETLDMDMDAMDRELLGVENDEVTRMCSVNDQLKSTLEELEDVCSAQEMTNVCGMEQLRECKAEYSSRNNELGKMELIEGITSASSSSRDNCESNIMAELTNTDDDNLSIKDVSRTPGKDEVQDTTAVKTVETISGISGSLQLIGEAYTSEDSQETSVNGSDTKEVSFSSICKKNFETYPEEGNDAVEKISKSQHNVDNCPGISSNKNAEETCKKKEVSILSMDDQAQLVETNPLEEAKEDSAIESKSDIDLPCQKQESSETSEASVKDTHQSERIEIIKTEQDAQIEHMEIEATKETSNLTATAASPQDKKSEAENLEESETIKSQKVKLLDNESTSLESLPQVQSSKIPETNNEIVSEDVPCDIELVDKLDAAEEAGSKEETSEAIEKTETLPWQIETREDPSCPEIKKLGSMDTTDDYGVPQDTLNTLQDLKTEPKMITETLESGQEIQNDSLQSFITRLALKTNEPMDSEQSSLFAINDNLELPARTEELLPIVAENTVAADNISMDAEENKCLKSILSEKDSMERDSVPPLEELLIPQKEVGDETKALTSMDSRTISEASKVESDEHNLTSKTSILHLDVDLNISNPVDTSTLANDSEERIESPKIVDKVDKNDKLEETLNIDTSKAEKCAKKNLQIELNEVKDTILEEPFNLKEALNETDICSIKEKESEKEEDKSSVPVDIEEEPSTDETPSISSILKDNESMVETRKEKQMEEEEKIDIKEKLAAVIDDTHIALEKKSEEIVDQIKDNTEDEVVPELKIADKVDPLPPSEPTDIIIPKVNIEEKEGIEEELNLPLDIDEPELPTDLNTINPEKISEQQLTVEEKTVKDIKPSAIEAEELLKKEAIEENLKNESESSNLKSIIESAKNAGEIFSEEQCQNTQDIVTSILDDVRTATDFKNILGTNASVENEIEQVLEQSAESPLVEDEIEELSEKLPQNMDSLEGLLGLDLIPEGEEDSALKETKADEESQDQETLSKDMSLLLEQSSRTSEMEQASDYITDVISSCLADSNVVSLEGSSEKPDIADAINKDNSKELEEPTELFKDSNVADIEKNLPVNELDMDFEENPLESVGDLEETSSKLELPQDILLENVDQNEDLNLNSTTTGIENSHPSSEISELESAVKFLQESEERTIDSPLVLSPKLVESVVEDVAKEAETTSLFVPDEDICEDASVLVAELENIAADSISISEAEIISEAAKLENERKLAEQDKIDAAMSKLTPKDTESKIDEEAAMEVSAPEAEANLEELQKIEVECQENEKISEPMCTLSRNVFKPSTELSSIPKISILEERLKEPPKIEIPITDVTKVSLSPTSSKDSLLIQKDAKMMAYQRMLESPKLSEKSESKVTDTPKKDPEKHDFENVGSPRIILKIAKSAITDCSEPRSPKSPKIRSATNSPNPEDSPGQKLGKIKLKLSKGGHPSIISNENVEETAQWHSEGSASLSPLGMKIKLSKFGDASIVSSEKHESTEDPKESKHKFEEAKRTESPIGMKIKLSKTGDASIVQQESKETKEMQIKQKDKLDIVQGSPKRSPSSPIGMKIKLSKSGDASIIQPERQEFLEEHRETALKTKDTCYGSPKRTDSPIGMKIKLSKSGDASIVAPDTTEETKETSKLKEKLESSPEIPKRTESPVGMKIKLAKTKGGASIISLENAEDTKEKLEIPDVPKRTESPLGMKIKLSKSGDASIVHSEISEETKDSKVAQETSKAFDSEEINREGSQEISQRIESPLGMKIKLSKFGEPSIVSSDKSEQGQREEHKDPPKRTESPIGMKIKLSKTGDASIIQAETSEDPKQTTDAALGMKIKLLKTGDASIVETEKKEKQRRRDTESPLEMKIKLSKTGHPTIVACETHGEAGMYKPKEPLDQAHSFSPRYKDPAAHKEPALKILKTGHSTILQSNRSELTIEPVQTQSKKESSNAMEISPKRKDITISPIESKKSKLETQLSQILPEVTIQPVMTRDQKQLLFDPKTSLISRQQMNVISQEISITQVRPSKTADPSMNEKLKDLLSKNVISSPINSDCEIIEHRPELIIVNENSNSSQDVMIIEEVPSNRLPEVKVPKKRGRPRRNPIPQVIGQLPPQMLMPRDPLAMEHPPPPPVVSLEHRENERPKRTCRSQKSYAPPKRGRGRGRGKRKLDSVDLQFIKKPKIEQDLSAIEASTMSVITIDEPRALQGDLGKSELYKALQQPPMDLKDIHGEASNLMLKPPTSMDSKKLVEVEKLKGSLEEKSSDKADCKDMLVPPGHSNWLTPTSKRLPESASRNENVSTVQVIDEETRMSAESGSRSQTPARNISAPASETLVNEESQGSVLSTATTESEKVKVKNRRMEINFDPDEGPFTVDKIAEYEWPPDRKGETFMIQEQISQYLGVKSFKRKYPDLKRRVVDMEERNFLRENGLVSEAMCDMGLTAVCSSEVLDVMCSDFPDQYEEYRKHMREKQVKEHSKKQKELTAAANAEKNRIDLAEMAVQSALSWNVNLNKDRKENRKCSLDLQTFTIHVPKKQQKVESERKISHYPVALIPGQYTDYYREYTAAELRYYPLNTVLYGPMRPNERKFDSQSEGSQSDSDSDSSSDDSSSSSSEGTQDTEGSQSTMDEVDMEIVNQKEELRLKCKMCLKALNKHSKNEVLIQCGTCNGNVHPSCIDLTLDMVPHIQSYAWQCTDCKTCAQCHDPADEDKMLFCDMCDRGYHIYCVGLRRVPQGRWHCQECAICANCSSREPGGLNSDRNSVAQWQHEYKKGDKNTRVYVSTLCVPCSKLWRKGRYCPHCSRCHTAPRLDLEANLVHCSACDKYLHLGCVETKGMAFDRKNYLCEFCTPSRQHVMKPLVSKIFKT